MIGCDYCGKVVDGVYSATSCSVPHPRVASFENICEAINYDESNFSNSPEAVRALAHRQTEARF